MKTRTLSIIALVGCLLFLTTSCQSDEKRTIKDLKKLATKVEKNHSKYDADDWADALEDYEEIHEDMKYCDFTNEQLREIGRIDGKLAMILTREYSKALGKGLNNLIGGATAFTQGLVEGMGEEGLGDDYEDVDLDELSNQLDALLGD